MGKIVFMLLIAVIAWALFKKRNQLPSRDDATKADETVRNASGDTNTPNASQAKTNTQIPERMVACAACGVFMPESDSVQINGVASCRDPAQCAHRPRGDVGAELK